MKFPKVQIGNARRLLLRVLAWSALLTGSLTLLYAQRIPASTAIPVEFVTSLQAGKTPVGAPVTARTMQVVVLPDGTEIPKGTHVTGHVTESAAFCFDEAPYAIQKPSQLGVAFDRIELKNGPVAARFSLRAIASVSAVDDGSRPFNETEYVSVGRIYQVGGDSYLQFDTRVFSRQGNVVEYVRRNGIFGRLLANDADHAADGLQCDAVGSEQSVAVFSAGACGAYGFSSTMLTENGGAGGNTFVLAAAGFSAEIPAHSAALLQVAE